MDYELPSTFINGNTQLYYLEIHQYNVLKPNAMKRILVILVLISTFYSCEKVNPESLSKNPPSYPLAQDYDLNNDQTKDFQLVYSYYTYDGLNISGDGISGQLVPLNQNMILAKANTTSLFLQYNDTIKAEVTTPYSWQNSQAQIIQISTTPDYFWPKYWGIRADQKLDYYYLGIKINNTTENLVGWLKLQLDTTSGKVYIRDQSFTNKNLIIAGK